MTIEQIISEIYESLKPQVQINNNQRPAMMTFKYTRPLKSDEYHEKLNSMPTISIYGQENIDKYMGNYLELYSKLKMSDRKISFNHFLNLTQQLLFTNEFTRENIVKEVEAVKTMKLYHLARIYGIRLINDSMVLGKYTFIKKEKILEYIDEKMVLNKDGDEYKWFIEGKVRETAEDTHFIYLLIDYETIDSDYCKELFDRDYSKIINVLRYMAGIKHERVYIDSKVFHTYINHYDQFIENGLVLGGISIKRKDIPVELDTDYFNSKENGNFYIWEIVSKDNNNKLEERIIKSIDWIGTSINEEDESIAITEVAFAFECLLKNNESSQISPSIQSHISETIAFLIGKDLEDRKNIVKRFKEFYSFRSSIAHGNKKNNNGNYFQYLYMFKSTLSSIILNPKYRKSASIEMIFNDLIDLKFK